MASVRKEKSFDDVRQIALGVIGARASSGVRSRTPDQLLTFAAPPADHAVVGLTTENAHIWSAARPALGLDDAAGAIRAFMNGFEYEETPGAADRVFTLVAHPPWISVYDTETGQLDDLVRSLSKTLGAYVAGIRVEDSDKYSARLCRAGRWVDRISASVLRKKGAGKPELWAEVLAAGSEQDAARAMQGGGTFAEEPLRHLCRAMGLEASAALRVPDEMSEQPPEGALLLHYRALLHKAPQGPPLLALVNSGSAPATQGQHLQQLFVAVANDGPTAKGVRVRFAGEALTRGLIAPVELHVTTIIAVGGGIMGDRKTHPLGRDEQGWFASLTELELKSRVDPRTLPSGAGMLKALKEYHRRAVYFHLAAEAVRAGSAEVVFLIEWLDGAGAPLEVRLPVTVNAAG
jgi:hypothetical protein